VVGVWWHLGVYLHPKRLVRMRPPNSQRERERRGEEGREEGREGVIERSWNTVEIICGP
jgi:hypothetical protein